MAEDREIKTLEEDLKVQEYSQKLRALRENGVTKLNDARIELTSVKKNKLIDDSDRQKRIEELKKIIEEASVVAEKNKAEVNALSKEAVKYVNSVSREIEQKVNERQKRKMEGAKSFYQKEVEKIKAEGAKREEEIKATYANGDPQMLKSEIDICRYETKSALFDSKSRYLNEIDKAKAARHQAYVDHVQKNRELRNGKAAFGEDMKMKWKDFIRSFTPSAFFLANGLYIAIIIFFIVCIIAAPLRGSGNLLSLPNIFTILEQASTRMFYALGVAGLILLAGTDLSIGRMVALGSVTTGLILHPGMNIVSLFGMPTWDFSPLPMALRVIMALTLSIILCVLFSSVAGFFTAKFKMHPFISTMAMQLIIYGMLFYGTSGTPVVFIMAGVFYGCGSFLEAFRANASAGTGQGYEMDAIAACVVGGISFNGGIGKIGGAVLGVIIFTSLTYCLTFLGIDTNLQFVFKGFIILAAVTLDSIKYLKKK